MIIFVVSLKGFGWNNVGPASQTVTQHYFTIGQMYRDGVTRAVAFRGINVIRMAVSKHGTINQFCFNVGPATNRIDAYTDLSAMVVEGIGLHVEDNYTYLLGSFNN